METEQQIQILVEAIEAMQGHGAVPEQAAALAQQQRTELAARLAAAEQGFAASSAAAAADGGRGHPICSPRVDIVKSAIPMMPLVDTFNIGKVPNFSGDRDQRSEWSFQFTAFLGSASPMATKALKWAAGAEVPIDEDDVGIEDEEHVALSNQLYLALVLMCKSQALVMFRKATSNNGLETWRVLNSYCDPGSKGRQRVRMNQLFQPQKFSLVVGTGEAVER